MFCTEMGSKSSAASSTQGKLQLSDKSLKCFWCFSQYAFEIISETKHKYKTKISFKIAFHKPGPGVCVFLSFLNWIKDLIIYPLI